MDLAAIVTSLAWDNLYNMMSSAKTSGHKTDGRGALTCQLAHPRSCWLPPQRP